MRFENGINASLIMTAFSNRGYRNTRIRGTLGEIHGEFEKGKLILELYGKKEKVFKISKKDMAFGHGGGDPKLIAALAKGLTKTDISQSVESHLIGFAAEESRLKEGSFIKLRETE